MFRGNKKNEETNFRKHIILCGWLFRKKALWLTDNLRDSRRDNLVLYIQAIIDNAGKCFIKLEENIIPARKSEREIYSPVIERIRKETEKPLLIDKKVVIYLKEEL